LPNYRKFVTLPTGPQAVGELIIDIYRSCGPAIPPTPPEHEGMDGDVIMALYLHITLESRSIIDYIL
jgi:hypothetical protein